MAVNKPMDIEALIKDLIAATETKAYGAAALIDTLLVSQGVTLEYSTEGIRWHVSNGDIDANR